MKVFNTLTRRIEEFAPAVPPNVTLYACGPTVYDFAHIGNFRTYVFTDVLVRALRYMGYSVTYVMNITDVGHLVSDADSGEDKMEKGARREGKSAWDIAKYYTDAFLEDSAKLNLVEPDVRPKPTEHIQEQIDMVKTLIDKGFAYTINDGIYFDTSKQPDYGKLTGQNLEELKEGARVEVNPQKKNPTDFALWKFSYPEGRSFDPTKDDAAKRRQMEWDSPWGIGFPGWHIECSAMSRKHLGDQIDIHTGGADLIPVHHTNEIAQSEAATGVVPFVRFWLHGQFILVNNEKMSKSRGNFYRLADIETKGFNPLSLRYFYFTAHYRTYLNFTWETIKQSESALNQLYEQVNKLKAQKGERNTLSQEKLDKVNKYRDKFRESLENDLNMPQALAVVWEVVKSNIPSPDKYDLLMDFDEVLGLNLGSWEAKDEDIPDHIRTLLVQRNELRGLKRFSEADAVRAEIEAQGYFIEDTGKESKIRKKIT